LVLKLVNILLKVSKCSLLGQGVAGLLLVFFLFICKIAKKVIFCALLFSLKMLILAISVAECEILDIYIEK
jgi:hypothetical protein